MTKVFRTAIRWIRSDNPKSKIENPKWAGLFAIVVAVTMCGARAEAQQPTKIPRIGFVSARANPTPTTPDSSADALRQGLRNLGYIEGKNIVIEYRYLEGKVDRIPSLVAELLQLKLDVLVSVNTLAIRAFKQGTKTIPIVIVINDDPVTTGIVDSLAHPGGNVTGLTRFTRELSGKRLEVLKEAVPKISRVGVLDDASTDIRASFQDFEPAAQALKIQLQSLEVRGPNPDLAGAFQAAAKGRANALITVRTALLISYRKQIADLVIKNRLPSMSEGSDFVEAAASCPIHPPMLKSSGVPLHMWIRYSKAPSPPISRSSNPRSSS
jgi:ABC-type uncharacterized transport system substrate-binding protein